MMQRTTRIYKIGERKPPADKAILIFWKSGAVGVAPSDVLEMPHPLMTHWGEIPEIEAPSKRVRAKNS